MQYFGLAGECALYDKHFKSLRVVGLTDAATFFRALWVWRYNFRKSTNSQDTRKVSGWCLMVESRNECPSWRETWLDVIVCEREWGA